MTLQLFYIFLDALGILESMLIDSVSFDLLQVFELHDGLSVEVAEASYHGALFPSDPLLFDGGFFAIYEKGYESDLVEDVDVVGVVLVESELHQSQDLSSQVDVPELSGLVVGVDSRLERGIPHFAPAVLMVLFPLNIDPRTYLVLMRQKGQVRDDRRLQELNDYCLREGSESFADPALCFCRLQHQLRHRVLRVLAGAVVYPVVDSSRLWFAHPLPFLAILFISRGVSYNRIMSSELSRKIIEQVRCQTCRQKNCHSDQRDPLDVVWFGKQYSQKQITCSACFVCNDEALKNAIPTQQNVAPLRYRTLHAASSSSSSRRS